MKVLVTGGAGFIGSNLVRQLLHKQYEVVVLDNLSTGYEENLAGLERITFYRGDICDESLVRQALQKVEVVFHLAAAVGNKQSLENPQRDSQINVLGTINILEAARAAGVRKVVLSSSAAIYGEPRVLPLPEEQPWAPQSPYGVSKLAAERMALAYASLYGLECIALRYFNVYGPRQRYDAYGNVIPIFVHQMLQGETLTIYGDGEQTRDFVNVHDVVQANLLAAQAQGLSGAFNIGSGTSVSINQLVALLEQVTGQKIKVCYAPPRPGDVRASLADIRAARAHLRYEPKIDLVRGLKEYIEWVRTEIFQSAAPSSTSA